MTTSPKRPAALPVLLLSTVALSAWATREKPPIIALDTPPPEMQAATLAPEPTAPVQIVAIPEPLPLPGQLQRVEDDRRPAEPSDPGARVTAANDQHI